jgi:hypothetical protein
VPISEAAQISDHQPYPPDFSARKSPDGIMVKRPLFKTFFSRVGNNCGSIPSALLPATPRETLTQDRDAVRRRRRERRSAATKKCDHSETLATLPASSRRSACRQHRAASALGNAAALADRWQRPSRATGPTTPRTTAPSISAGPGPQFHTSRDCTSPGATRSATDQSHGQRPCLTWWVQLILVVIFWVILPIIQLSPL